MDGIAVGLTLMIKCLDCRLGRTEVSETSGCAQSHRVVLIVSTGRTGTKAIATHLDNCYEQLRALHEPPPTRIHLRRVSNRFMCGRLAKDQLVAQLRAHRDRILASTPQGTYVEANPGLAGFMDAFADAYQDFRVVHVTRDPRTYIRSALNWGVFRGARRFLSRFMPYWLPKPDYVDPAGPLRWRKMNGVERLAWYWKFINTHLDRGAALYPDRYLRVKFEDLFSRDGSGLTKLVQWIGLPSSDQLSLSANAENVNASDSGGIGRWEQWDESTRRMVLRYCAPLMRTYGYDLSADASLIDEPSAPASAPPVLATA